MSNSIKVKSTVSRGELWFNTNKAMRNEERVELRVNRLGREIKSCQYGTSTNEMHIGSQIKPAIMMVMPESLSIINASNGLAQTPVLDVISHAPQFLAASKSIIKKIGKFVLGGVENVFTAITVGVAVIRGMGTVLPWFYNGKIYLLLSPRADVHVDPHQPALHENNFYYRVFEDEKKFITPSILKEMGIEVPRVNLTLLGGIDLLDHHRVAGARQANKWIVVEIKLWIQSFN